MKSLNVARIKPRPWKGLRVSVKERERERDRQTDRQTETERETKRKT